MKRIFKIFISVFLLVSCSGVNKDLSSDNKKYELSKKPITRPEEINMDSVIIEKYISSLKLDRVKDYLRDTIISTVDWHKVDSLLDEMYITFFGEKVLYSPDSSFKIFVISSEGCGAYCNTDYYSFVHLKNNRKVLTDKELLFGSTVKMYQLTDSKYLIVQNYGARSASVLTVGCTSINLISIKDERLFFIK